MRHAPWIMLLALLVSCGQDDARQTSAQAQAQTRTEDGSTHSAPRPTPTKAEGHVMQHPEAGFSIYWPAGCERLNQKESDGPTRLAEREVITSCVRSDLGFTVRLLDRAHDVNGEAPHPRLVVSLIEQQLDRKKLRTVRQRPLESGGVQGVEVQAEGRDSQQRAWLRGFLVGTDIYLLMVVGEAEDIFERAEVQDFFYSFDIDGQD